MPEETVVPPEALAARTACLDHAEDLLRAAEAVYARDELPHIAYHLGALALEEVGKAELLTMDRLAHAEGEEVFGRKQLEDHVRKLFWALWGPSFGREVIDKAQIETFQGLARQIHETRLQGLYFGGDAAAEALPRSAIERGAVEHLLALTRARLELAKNYRVKVLDPEEQKDLRWYASATKDEEQRKLILGRKSMEKLAEIQDVAGWIRWLREEFEKAEAEGRLLAERELQREAPPADEAGKPKWKLKVRLVTNSHSIRPKPLNWWNGIASWIKLYPAGSKKNELIAEFTLPAAIPVHGLWVAGWGNARRFVTALNIASLGYFWWYLPRDVSRFYEELWDLESDSKMVIERSPILAFRERRDALTEADLRRTAIFFGMLPGPSDEEAGKVYGHYLTGLAFLAKNDIHLQLEANAYEQFYRAFRLGLELYGEWDGTGSFGETFKRVVDGLIPGFDESDRLLELGDQLLQAPPALVKPINLEDAAKMKALCDAFFAVTLKKRAEEKRRVDRDEAGDDTGIAEKEGDSNGKGPS